MVNRIRILNILLLLALFPLLSLLVRDYLVYKYVARGKVTKELPAAAPPPAPKLTDYAPIIEYSMFPSKTSRLVPLASRGAAPEAPEDAEGPPGTAIENIVLVGTFVGERRFAVFEDRKKRVQEVFRVGERVFETGMLKSIGIRRAEMEVGGRTIPFEIEDDLPEDGEGLSAPRADGGPGTGFRFSRKMGETDWVIDRKAVFGALKDLSKVLTDARLTPVMKDGGVEGFLVTEIKPRGIFDAIGLKNGDILKRVNGYEIDSPEKAIQVLSAIKGETKVHLDLVRDGQKKSFRYEIR